MTSTSTSMRTRATRRRLMAGAELAVLRSYAAFWPDLGLHYAKDNNWDDARQALVQQNIDKVERKFSNPNFWITAPPDTLEAHEAEMARIKNA